MLDAHFVYPFEILRIREKTLQMHSVVIEENNVVTFELADLNNKFCGNPIMWVPLSL